MSNFDTRPTIIDHNQDSGYERHQVRSSDDHGGSRNVGYTPESIGNSQDRRANERDEALSNLYAPKRDNTPPMFNPTSFDVNAKGRSRVVYRADGQAQTINDGGFQRFEISQRADAERRGTWDLQVTDAWTGRVIEHSSGISPDNLIRLPNGMQCTVQSAVDAGILSVDPNGNYEYDWTGTPADRQAQAEEELRQQRHAPTEEALADTGAESLLSVLANDVAGTDQVSAVRQLVEHGEIDATTVSNIASQLGVEPSQFAHMAGRIVEAFSAQASSAVASVVGGTVDPQQVFDYFRSVDPAALKEAMTAQARERSTAGYKSLARQYAQTMDQHSPQAVLDAAKQAGIEASYDDRNGVVVLDVPGYGRMSWKSALDAGFISLSRR
jgi:hypothetical protein